MTVGGPGPLWLQALELHVNGGLVQSDLARDVFLAAFEEGVGHYKFSIVDLVIVDLLSNCSKFSHDDRGGPEHAVADGVTLLYHSDDDAVLLRSVHGDRTDRLVFLCVEKLADGGNPPYARCLELAQELVSHELDPTRDTSLSIRTGSACGLPARFDGAIEVVEHLEQVCELHASGSFDLSRGVASQADPDLLEFLERATMLVHHLLKLHRAVGEPLFE